MAYLSSNPYGFSHREWNCLSVWQRFKLFVWRHRYPRGFYCVFLRDRAKAEFLDYGLKGKDYQCKCEKLPPKGGAQCSCRSHTRCRKNGGKGYCWCKCTPDGTLSQGIGEETKYIYKEES